MIVLSQRMSSSLSMPDYLTVGSSNVKLSQSVKSLGVTLDPHLTMKNQVVNLVRTANFELQHINSIRHHPSFCRSYKDIFSAFVLSRLDYCNSHLIGCPKYLINRVKRVHNNVARLILKVANTDLITPHSQTLHRLPVDTRIQYKICSFCFSVNSSCPPYLADLLKVYSPSRHLRSSADTCALCIPSPHTKTFSSVPFHTLRPISEITFLKLSESAPSFKSAI